jgi:hypothetical protein
MNAVYLGSYGLKYFTMIVVYNYTNEISEPSFWEKVRNLNEKDLEGQLEVYQVFYWLNSGINYSIFKNFYLNLHIQLNIGYLRSILLARF